MNQSSAKLLREFCEITKADYSSGKRVYEKMNRLEKTQMREAMKQKNYEHFIFSQMPPIQKS